MQETQTNTLQRIISLAHGPDCRLRLTYADGFAGVVDLASVAKRGGVFARLQDAEYFRQVRIGEDGRPIEWPGELDMCADALRMQAEREAGGPGHSSIAG